MPFFIVKKNVILYISIALINIFGVNIYSGLFTWTCKTTDYKKRHKNEKGDHSRRKVGSNTTLFDNERFPVVSELLIENGEDNRQQYRNRDKQCYLSSFERKVFISTAH